jgi:pimeloyl-ACP methyl ester carboxylesterase
MPDRPNSPHGCLARRCSAAFAGFTPVIAPAFAWTEREVTVDHGGTLHGTIVLPGGDATVPGVVIVAGSGPVDRDGNVPGLPNDSLKLLAHGLADHGIASVRADKRAIGASRWDGLREADLRFGDYVRDCVAWAGLLRDEPRISRVALLGHSEGALVVTFAAARAQADRIVLLAGAGTPAGPIMERQFSAGGLPDDLRAELHRILGQLAAGEPATDIPAPLAPIFRPSVQPYLMSWLPIDPDLALSRVTAPVLVMQGSTDIQLGMMDARILAAARPGATLAIVDGMNHILRSAPIDRAANVATYRDPTLPLHPGVLPVLAKFLRHGT